MEEYNELVEQYEDLKEEEKKACLIYKSKLSFLINEIVAVPNFLSLDSRSIYENIKNKHQFLEIYLEYKQILKKSKNLSIQQEVMSSLNFETVQTIIDSLKEVYTVLLNTNMVTNHDVTLFRIVSTKKKVNSISKSNFVSTSVDVNYIGKLMINPYNELYQIDLEAGSKVLVIPYQLLLDSKDNTLKITKDDFNQKEVIIFEDKLTLEETETKTYENNLVVHKITAKNNKTKHL